ncbi:MAG: type II toxin-antitoxin system CcdA family antitoxin [Candidatus Bathyarchaeota archaeon]|nr:type II toxin-antitoxin system CcdA family antitoxin [Candidatus Bathyarchaeota archaeon]
MGKQKRVNLTIDEEVIRKAKDLGLNLSRVAENAFKEAIDALEQRKRSTETNGGYIDTRSVSHQQDWWTGRDLNPRPHLTGSAFTPLRFVQATYIPTHPPHLLFRCHG